MFNKIKTFIKSVLDKFSKPQELLPLEAVVVYSPLGDRRSGLKQIITREQSLCTLYEVVTDLSFNSLKALHDRKKSPDEIFSKKRYALMNRVRRAYAKLSGKPPFLSLLEPSETFKVYETILLVGEIRYMWSRVAPEYPTVFGNSYNPDFYTLVNRLAKRHLKDYNSDQSLLLDKAYVFGNTLPDFKTVCLIHEILATSLGLARDKFGYVCDYGVPSSLVFKPSV